MKNVFTYTYKGKEYNRMFTQGGIKQSLAGDFKYSWQTNKSEDYTITEYQLVKVREIPYTEFLKERGTYPIFVVEDVNGTGYAYQANSSDIVREHFTKSFPAIEIKHIIEVKVKTLA